MQILNTYQALVEYAKSQGLDIKAKAIRKLLTTLRLYVLKRFKISLGFSEQAMMTDLEKLSVERFVENARSFFEVAFEEAIQAGKKKETLQNDRSNLVSFLKWIEEQEWSLSAKRVSSSSANRGPRSRTGSGLSTVRKGKGKDTFNRQYALPEATLKAEHPHLNNDLTDFKSFWLLPSPPQGYTRLDTALSSNTAAKHYQRVSLFFGQILGMQVKLKHQKIVIQIQKLTDTPATKSDQKLYQQKQSLEQQLEILRADLDQPTPLERRRQEVVFELDTIQSQLRKSRRKELFEQKRRLETLLNQIDSLALDLILDPALFAQFIAWGRNVGKNSDGWAINFYDTAISVAKFRYGYQNPEVDYTDIPIIKSLRKARKTLSASYQTNVRKDKSEKWLEPEEMIIILKHLKERTAKYNHNGKRLSSQTILLNWQKYLLVLLMFYYPIRVREVCNMQWGSNLEWKLNKETKQEGYYCKYSEEETKTGKAKEWFLDPEAFNQPMREWLEVERPTAGVDHKFIFFMLRGESKGRQYTEVALANLFRNTIYAACRDLRSAAQEELQELVSQGKTEQEARQALSEDHQYFVDLDPRRTNIHYARHLGTTHIRKAELPHSAIKAFHKIIGNSPEMGDKVYNQMELHEETSAAVSWRHDSIETGKGENEAALKTRRVRIVGALSMILTKEQRRQLSEQGIDLMDLM